MVRALQRSILGRNCGASFCSTTVQRTPRRPRSMASVRPVGPAPMMRTWVSMSIRLELGELGALLHDVADGALERLQAAVGGRAQCMLHLHGLEHDERRAAPQIGARLCKNP